MDKDNSEYTERQACRAREMLQRLDVDAVKLTYLEDGRVFAAVKEKCLRVSGCARVHSLAGRDAAQNRTAGVLSECRSLHGLQTRLTCIDRQRSQHFGLVRALARATIAFGRTYKHIC